MYSMVKPNARGYFVNAFTSFALSKNLANSRSKSLSHGTKLKMYFSPSHTGRDQVLSCSARLYISNTENQQAVCFFVSKQTN